MHHPKYLTVSSWNQCESEWADTLRIIQAHMCLSVHTSMLHSDCFVSVVESPAGFHVAWLFDIPSIIDLSRLYIIPALSMLLHQRLNTFYKITFLLKIKDAGNRKKSLSGFTFSPLSFDESKKSYFAVTWMVSGSFFWVTWALNGPLAEFPMEKLVLSPCPWSVREIRGPAERWQNL